MTHDSGPLTVDLWCLFQPELLKSLSDILVHGGNSNVARRQSALQLKNFLSSNDEATRHIYQQVKSSDIQSFSYNLIRIFFVFMCKLHTLNLVYKRFCFWFHYWKSLIFTKIWVLVSLRRLLFLRLQLPVKPQSSWSCQSRIPNFKFQKFFSLVKHTVLCNLA